MMCLVSCNPHCVKSVQILSFFWSVFSRFELNMGRYPVSLCIQSECGKIRTRKNSVFRHFSRGVRFFDDMKCSQNQRHRFHEHNIILDLYIIASEFCLLKTSFWYIQPLFYLENDFGAIKCY